MKNLGVDLHIFKIEEVKVHMTYSLGGKIQFSLKVNIVSNPYYIGFSSYCMSLHPLNFS